MSPVTLVIEQLVKQFPTAGEPLEVLRGVSMTLAPGQNVAILGPSGSGKSTLLSIVGTLDTPTSGRVQLAGEDPFSLSEAKLASYRADNIGFVFQEHHLLPQCTVLENVLLPLLADGVADQAGQQRATELLERVGLSDRLHHRPAEISGGERQRTAVARALIRQPRLVLADEPTGNLDRLAAQRVGQLLVELGREQEMMLIVVTHSQPLADKLDCRRALVDGVLVDERDG